MSYGLGNLNDNLPAFVVLPDPRGLPYNATGNFSRDFCRRHIRELIINPNAEIPIANLNPPESAKQVTRDSERAGLELLHQLNAATLAEHPGDSRFKRGWLVRTGREVAVQCAAGIRLVGRKRRHARRLWRKRRADTRLRPELPDCPPIDGTRCALRAGMERHGRRDDNWDNHSNIPKELPLIARSVDHPTAALLRDLKAAGLLDDTLFIWTTEFGRMPFTQGATGRDHNGGDVRLVARGGRYSARNAATARATSLAIRPPKAAPTATICTPRFCTCWASTISG